MTLIDFLNYLRGPGIDAALGVLLSFIIEWLPNWDTLAPRSKRVFTLLICLAIPLLATVGLALMGAVDVTLPDTWWLAVMSGAMAYGGSQVAHLRKMSTTRKLP